MGLEREVVSSSTFQIQNLGLSLTAAAILPIDLRMVTLSFGAEAGLVLIRQSYATTADESDLDTLPATPALMQPRWSNGWQFGPLAQLDFPLGEEWYMRFEAAFPYRYFKPSDDYDSSNSVRGHANNRGGHLHIVAGAGLSF
jgi:hypothetical protein